MKTYISKLMLTVFTVLSMQAFAQNPPMGIGNGLTVKEPALPDSVNLNNAFLKGVTNNKKEVIYFVHGLGGGTSAWDRGVEATTLGKIKLITLNDTIYDFRPANGVVDNKPSYTEKTSLDNAGSDLAREFENFHLTNPVYEPGYSRYIIAHSQGGLVSRAAVRLMENSPNYIDSTIGGLVTFGSPHLGAKILNNGLPTSLGGRGQIQSLARDACISLGKGPALSYAQDFVKVGGVFGRFIEKVVFKTVNKATDFACQSGSNVLPFALSNYTQNLVKDYFHNSDYLEHPITGLNNYIPSNFPMVAFWGEEEDPEFWRLTNSLVSSVTNEDLFEANDDSTKFDYKKLRADLRAEWVYQRSYIRRIKNRKMKPCKRSAWTITRGSCRKKLDRAESTRDAYDRGIYFVDNVNAKWESIIGARKDTLIQNGYNCTCQLYRDPNNTISFPVSSPSVCKPVKAFLSNCQTTSLHWELKTLIKPHDGVVTAKSAKSLPGKIVIPGERYDMQETNHMQMRNNKALKTKLDKLYDGDYGFFFQIPRQN